MLNFLFGFILFIGTIVLIISLFSINKNKSTQNLNFIPNSNAEPYCLIFDIETTGLILDKNIKPSVKSMKENPENFPRIVSISWGVFSRNENLICEGDFLIKQETEIPDHAVKIHGITTEKANTEGIDILDALHKFELDCQKVTTIVGHNIMFDKHVVESEFLRAKLKKPFTNKTTYCTMKMGKEFLKIYKNPTLSELCIGIYGNGIKDQLQLHNSQMDTFFTSKCFFHLKKQKNQNWSRHV
ncbi:3'-5' exonuclease [Flavobacterium aquiphilum]|uniref:3'-5' exonuclease n=1 Tax=Flavobacterium aquiphilum TaxID=3003261 RepID=UPI00248135A6|nr:3'-5' exonuclease [Flavobacterium aquiphilum]